MRRDAGRMVNVGLGKCDRDPGEGGGGTQCDRTQEWYSVDGSVVIISAAGIAFLLIRESYTPYFPN